MGMLPESKLVDIRPGGILDGISHQERISTCVFQMKYGNAWCSLVYRNKGLKGNKS